MQPKNRYLFALLLLSAYIGLGSLPLAAQVRFTAEAPPSVAVGEQFKILFTLHGGITNDFSSPDFVGLDVLFAPQNAVTQRNLNGKQSITFTGTFRAQAVGVVKVGSASCTYQGKTYRTKPLKIDVVAAGKKTGGKSTQGGSIAPGDIYIKAVPAKRKVYLQEGLLLGYKLYTTTPRVNFEQVKFPEHEGFIEEAIPFEQVVRLDYERVGGRPFYTGILRESVIYPQRTGKLTIPEGQFDLVITLESQAQTIEELFGQSALPTIKRKVVSPAVEIEVLPLPEPQPEGFDNLVGDFRVSAHVEPRGGISQGEVFTYHIVVEGRGNHKLMAAPQPHFPEGVESYEPTSTGELKTTTGGTTGKRTFSYNLVARNEGRCTIPPVEIRYFHPASGSYRTLTTQAITLEIAKGSGSSLAGTGRLDGNMPAPLKPLSPRNTGRWGRFVTTPWIALPYLLVLLLSMGIWWCVVLWVKHYGNASMRRSRTALAKAKKRFSELPPSASWAECEAIVQEYLTERLSIPQGETHASSLLHIATQRGWQEESYQPLYRWLTKSASNRYAPEDTPQQEYSIAQEALHAIEKLNATLTR